MTTEPTEDFTDDQARRLLSKAAATIDVDETAPMTLTGLPEPRPRRWPVLAAAAAVVLAIGAGYLVAQQLGDDPQPAPVVDKTDAADREPVEQEHVYTDDQMPSLLGYTEDEATELIHSRGNPLRIRAEYSCELPKGYVIGTDPGPGSPLAPNDEVEIRVIAGILREARCFPAGQGVWDLVRFARGLGPAPPFPDEVSIAVGEGEFVTLTAEEAADPANWVLCDNGECHSPLAALEQVLTAPEERDDGYFASTFLVVTDDLPVLEGPEPVCLTQDPMGTLVADKVHSATYVYVDSPFDGARLCPPPPVIQIDWTEDQRIASVRLRLAVEAETIDEETLAGSLERLSSATRFVAWARGEGRAPEFAGRVRVMFFGGGAFGHPGWTDDPESRSSYAGCSGPGFPDCALDPVALLVRHHGRVVATEGRSTCADGGEVPARFGEAEADVVRLEEPEPASCRNAWAIELWIDEDGVIYGVNQAGSGPG
ncbi:PASTA domain-containing protein [Nocardioides bizhenqiangii]|uniref:PASTA domain-containing protein n=1 Tax=Nocardioides bizhenqiangii TaxID=3095076 RepID=A0ABZ0ZPB2_9ACTN|nr:PASTA domain-containing protein [Nocardioides sp. HM61]WQQ26180.1 PASTA domain-containing protein [Nocardioides sp. HM61]